MGSTGNGSVTLKSIAGMVGCTPSAVSVVLNGSHGNTKVSDELRERIIKVASEVNYRPNSVSQSLRRRSCRTLGVFVGNGIWHGLGMGYEMSLFRGVEQVSRKYGYDLLLLNMNFQLDPDYCFEKLASHRVDGLILIHITGDVSWMHELHRQNNNIVVLDCSENCDGIDNILFDGRAAVLTALRHLQRQGHRKVGFIGSCLRNGCESATRHRMEAFENAVSMEEFAGMELSVYSTGELEEDQDYCQLEGIRGMQYFLSCSERPTALIAYNSLVGMCAKQEAERQGVKIPEEMSIIGIDRAININSFAPGLSAVDHPLEEMGISGTELLIAKIENRDFSTVKRMYSGSVVDDTTTAPPKADA